MINVVINDNYLHCREYYAVLFRMLSEKKLSLDSFSQIIINAKNKDSDALLNELNGIFGSVLMNVEFYLREIKNEIIPIEELSFLKNERLSFLFFNYLSLMYKNDMDKMNHRSILEQLMKCSPLELNSMIKKDIIPFNYVVFFIDFLHFFINSSDFKEIIFNIRDKGISILECYPAPFSFLQKNDDSLSWIVNRMLKEDMWNFRDINVLLQNTRWKSVLSCFDFWAISAAPSSTKLFLLQSKKAWSQKKYRDSVKNKEVLNTYISKEAKLKLKKIAKYHNKNINEIIEAMIEQIDLPRDPLEELILLVEKKN